MRHKDTLGQDSEGRYRRSIGNKLGNERITQHVFRLGRDRVEAERRNRLLELLWSNVEARWKRRRAECRTNDPVPLWDDLTLEIGRQLAQGISPVTLPTPEELRTIWTDTPKFAVLWLRAHQEDFPGIPLTLAEPTFLERALAAETVYVTSLTEVAEQLREKAESAARSVGIVTVTSGGPTLHEALDAFSTWIGETKRRDGQVTMHAVVSQKQVALLKSHHADIPLSRFGLPEIEGAVTYWANRPQSKRGQPVAPTTASSQIDRLREFVTFLHKSSFPWRRPEDYEVKRVKIRTTPAENAKKVSPQQVKRYSLDELNILWQYARPQERAWMLLGLNCGFGRAELGTLHCEEFFPDESKIKRLRTKTGVYAEWELWPETVRAVEFLRGSRRTGLVAMSEHGAGLTSVTKGGNANQAIPNAWDKLLGRVRKDHPEFRKLSFGKLRKTGINLVRQVAGGEVAAVFAAHGQPTSDPLLEVYADRPFDAVFLALGKVRTKLEPMLSSLVEPFKKPPRHKISLGTIARIKALRAEGKTLLTIAKELGISTDTVQRHWGQG